MIEKDHSIMERLFVQYLEKKKIGRKNFNESSNSTRLQHENSDQINENDEIDQFYSTEFKLRKRKFEPEINFISQHFRTGYSSKRHKNRPVELVLSQVSTTESMQRSKIVRQAESSSDVCVICCGDLNDNGRKGQVTGENTLKLQHCGHSYHSSCIFRWQQENNSCPLCRTSLSSEVTEDKETGRDEMPEVTTETTGSD